MKKTIFLLLFCGTMFSLSAQTTTTSTTTTHKYYYYPSSNVYFDEESSNYWYWDNSSNQWSMVQTLPANVTVTETTKRYPITYKGDDPWKNNNADKMKYKTKKNGKGKMKSKH